MNNTLAELKEVEKYVDKKVAKIEKGQEEIQKKIDKSKEEKYEQICDDIFDLFQYSDVLMTEVPCRGYAKDKDGNDQFFFSFVKPKNCGSDAIALSINGRIDRYEMVFKKSEGYHDFEDNLHLGYRSDVFDDWEETYAGIIRATKDYMIHEMKEKIRISEENQKYWEEQYNEYCG